MTVIVIRPLDEDNLAELNRCDNSFTVSAELRIQTQDGHIGYTVRQVSPYVKHYGNESYATQSFIGSPDRATWLAYVGGQLSGQILVGKNWNRYAIVWNIAVDPPFRRQGVGRRLIEQAIQWAQDKRLPGVMLETQNNNVAACRLYERCGFALGGFDGYLYRGIEHDSHEIALFWYLLF